MKMDPGNNVLVCLKDENGVVVPSSVRQGHNVFTNYGRTWLRDLMIWDTIGAPDVPLETRRIGRIYYGRGAHLETKNVTYPDIVITAYFMAARNVSFPTASSCAFSHSVPSGSWNGVLFSEMGLGLRAGPYDNRITHYRTFEPILKVPGFSLETYWELSF